MNNISNFVVCWLAVGTFISVLQIFTYVILERLGDKLSSKILADREYLNDSLLTTFFQPHISLEYLYHYVKEFVQIEVQRRRALHKTKEERELDAEILKILSEGV